MEFYHLYNLCKILQKPGKRYPSLLRKSVVLHSGFPPDSSALACLSVIQFCSSENVTQEDSCTPQSFRMKPFFCIIPLLNLSTVHSLLLLLNNLPLSHLLFTHSPFEKKKKENRCSFQFRAVTDKVSMSIFW